MEAAVISQAQRSYIGTMDLGTFALVTAKAL
jgi:hypothetical protein